MSRRYWGLQCVDASGFLLIAQLRIFKQSGNRIEAEAGYAAIEPEAHRIEHGLFDLRIAPVEVRLLGIELVVVPLLCGGIVFPGGVSKGALPVVGRDAGSLAIAPDVPVALGIVARAFGLDEPRMLVRGVVHDHIHDDADVSLLRFGDKLVEVREVTVLGDRHFRSRRCRTRSQPGAKGRSATARWRLCRETAGSRGAR